MKPFEYYSKVSAPFPVPSDYNKVYVYDDGEVVWEGTQTEWRHSMIKIAQDYPNHVKQTVKSTKLYQEASAAYYAERSRLKGEFMEDVFEEFGVSENPKRFKCFQLAWDYSHEEGHPGVYDKFAELVELIQD